MKQVFFLHFFFFFFGIYAMKNTDLLKAQRSNVALKAHLLQKINQMIAYKEDLNQQFSDIPIPWKRPLLIIATLHNFPDIVQLLLTHGADPNIVHSETGSALHCAARCGYTDLSRYLLKYADPNIQVKYKRSPLALAAARGYINIAELLLQTGADPNAGDQFGMRPLLCAATKGYWASVSDERRKQMVYLLLFYGAQQKHCRTLDNKNAYQLAVSNGFCNSALALARYETHKERLFQAVKQKNMPAIKSLVLKCSVMIRDAQGNTPLHYAVDNNDMPMVGFLCSINKQLLDVKNNQGCAPIVLAANKRPLNLFSLLYAHEIKKSIMKTIGGPQTF